MFSNFFKSDYGSFSFSIVGGQHTHDRYVKMRHGQKYSVNIQNNSSKRCQASLNIDGRHMGDFLVGPHSNIEIDRPVHSHKRFTFYRTDMSSSFTTGIIPGRHDNGLVEVTFIPERRKIKTQTSAYTSIFDADSCDLESASYCTNEIQPLGFRNSSYAEGGTALSGHSHQHFHTVGPIALDYSKQTTLSYRLVGYDRPMYEDDIEPIYFRQRPPPPVVKNWTPYADLDGIEPLGPPMRDRYW